MSDKPASPETQATDAPAPQAVSYANSLSVLDKTGKPLDFGKIVVELATVAGSSGATEISNIATLRSTEPTVPGQLALVLEYTTGTRSGGGLFVYDASDTTTPEDYGLNIVTPKKARWKRFVLDYNNVSVVDFGAVPDGTTDCIEAVKRMYNWSQANYPATGIRFTAGAFMLSKFDISDKQITRFKLSGAPVDFGYFPTTTLYSNHANSEVMFSVKARYVEISGLIVEGGSDPDKPETFNSKGFFKNAIPGGQFLRVSSVDFKQLGGRALDLLDTLDCKIDQWYASHCQNAIIYARWSGQTAGVWDHSTAIELSNFNVQYNSKYPAIDAPRCTQSLIRNGWIEHSEFPGDLSNGQWIIEALSIEDCDNPLKLAYCRAIAMQKNIQSGPGFDFTPEGERWLSQYEEGNIELANNGIIVNGSLSADYFTGQLHLDNRNEAEKWFYVGEMEISGLGCQVHMRVVGTAAWNSLTATQTDFTRSTPEGVAHIYLQAGNSSPMACWFGEGASPVTRVFIEGSNTACKIYLKMAPYSAYPVVLVDTNSKDRFQAGVHFRYTKSFTACDASKSAAIEAAPSNVFEQHWLGNGSVGLGYNHNKELLFRGTTVMMDGVNAATRCLRVRVNGTEYGIELRPIKSA